MTKFNFNLRSLNYACMIAAFRFPENKLPEVLIVEYNDYGQNQKRLPTGTFVFEDAIAAVESIRKENTKYENSIFGTITDLIKEAELSFKESIKGISDRHQKNKIFGEKLFEIIAVMDANKGIDQELIEEICYRSRIETAKRKLIIETNSSMVGTLLPMSIYRLSNGHEKCGLVSVEVEAPDFTQGSGDNDIWVSHWKPVGEVYKKLFASKSANHINLLQSAIREAITQDLHPRVNELEQYWTSNNPI